MHKNTFSIYIKIYKTRLNKTGRIFPIRCQWSSTGTHRLDLGFADFLSNISSTHIFFYYTCKPHSDIHTNTHT